MPFVTLAGTRCTCCVAQGELRELKGPSDGVAAIDPLTWLENAVQRP